MTWPPGNHEFGFELAACAWAEARWPPDGESAPTLVARQLGWKRRRWDTIVLEVDPEGLRARLEFPPETLNADLRHVLRNAPEEWTYYRDTLPQPGYPWRYVREAIHEAADRHLLHSRKRSGRIEIKRIRPYPDWVERIVAIENKPDLDASAARTLANQLERDVAAGITDEAWLATSRTDRAIEPALLEEIPPEVGILTLGPTGGEVLWQPAHLAVSEPGIDILERPSGTGHDQSAARFDVLSPEEKHTIRMNVAERGLKRGFRSWIDAMRADCAAFDLEHGRYGYHPYCAAFGRAQSPMECRGSCPHFAPEPPTHRQGGWPIEGGPGATAVRILENRRSRRRQSVSSTDTESRETASR